LEDDACWGWGVKRIGDDHYEINRATRHRLSPVAERNVMLGI